MLLCLVAPILIYLLFTLVAARCAGKGYGVRRLAIRFSFIFLPLTLFYHLAHNGMHFFSEIAAVVPILSDPFGIGWDLFGTANYRPQPLLPHSSSLFLQLALLGIGYHFSFFNSPADGRAIGGVEEHGETERNIVAESLF